MQHKVQMKRYVSLRMKDVLALETLVESYFCPTLRNVYFHLSQIWITFTNELQLDYLKNGHCMWLYMSSVFICMHRVITFKFQSQWGRSVQPMCLHKIKSLWWFRVKWSKSVILQAIYYYIFHYITCPLRRAHMPNTFQSELTDLRCEWAHQ